MMLQPISRKQWNNITAAHLLNRAGFGASPPEIEEAADKSPAEIVNHLVDYQEIHEKFDRPSWVDQASDHHPDHQMIKMMSEDERRMMRQDNRKDNRKQLVELRAWWLYRMRYSPRPLQEKLTLFWHGHFATSAQKVRSTYCLYQQNETLRQYANGNWKDLVVAIARDPAMLLYLDNARNRRRAPNENFARELMELFTLGEGHYTEEDIKEAARAFTGWTLERDSFTFVNQPRMHDRGRKRFMGQSGSFDGEDIVSIIIAQPRAAEFIVHKLWEFFAYEDPEPELVTELASVMRKAGNEIKPVLKTMFLSRSFYSARAVRQQVKSPVQWLIGMSRTMEAPLPSVLACNHALHLLGQDLFAPPNVKGWDGGRTWITTSTLLHRFNLSGALVRGGKVRGMRLKPMVDAEKIFPRLKHTNKDDIRRDLQWRLFQGPLRPKDEALFQDLFAELPDPVKWKQFHIEKALHSMMSTPVYQVT